MMFLLVALFLLAISFAYYNSILPSPFYLFVITTLCLLLLISSTKNHRYSRSFQYILIITITVVMVAILSLLVWSLVKGNENAISYWGAVIGGIISGGVAVAGVIATINYYKKSDADKARISVQPFLKVLTIATYPTKVESREPDWIAPSTNELWGFTLTLTNIGNGFANILYICKADGDRERIRRIVDCEDKFDIIVYLPLTPKGGEYSFKITFKDTFGNKYSQEVVVKRTINSVSGFTGAPILIK